MSDFRDFFSKNAESFAKSSSHRSGEDLAILIEHIKPAAGETALDLAAGTGFTSLALAKRVSRVVAYDGTPEMLEQAKTLAREEGITSIEFITGDVSELPFPERSFDIITCRRAAHHFTDKPKFLSEAFRVLNRGGRFGLVDMATPAADRDGIINALERIRDPSHVAAESVQEWRRLVAGAGFSIREILTSREEYTIERWLSPLKMDTQQGKEVSELIANAPSDSLAGANVDREKGTLLKERFILMAERQ